MRSFANDVPQAYKNTNRKSGTHGRREYKRVAGSRIVKAGEAVGNEVRHEPGGEGAPLPSRREGAVFGAACRSSTMTGSDRSSSISGKMKRSQPAYRRSAAVHLCRRIAVGLLSARVRAVPCASAVLILSPHTQLMRCQRHTLRAPPYSHMPQIQGIADP